MRRFLYWLSLPIITIILGPLAIMGLGIITVRVIWRTRNNDISVTAYVPLAIRWVLHETGKRDDRAGRTLLMHLPGISSSLVRYTLQPLLSVIRAANLHVAPLVHPLYENVSVFRMIDRRTKFFDVTVERYKEKVEQIVILGSGWGSRAYSLQSECKCRVFEVDRKEMMDAKRVALKSANIDISDISFIDFDLNRDGWVDVMKNIGFDPSEPTLVIAEGVLPYLDPKGMRSVLGSVSTQLGQESAIVFDYLSTNIIEYSFSRQIAGWCGESWRWGLDTKPPAVHKIAAFLRNQGLSLKDFSIHGDEVDNHSDGGLVLAIQG